jgi:hypothetical protein
MAGSNVTIEGKQRGLLDAILTQVAFFILRASEKLVPVAMSMLRYHAPADTLMNVINESLEKLGVKLETPEEQKARVERETESIRSLTKMLDQAFGAPVPSDPENLN